MHSIFVFNVVVNYSRKLLPLESNRHQDRELTGLLKAFVVLTFLLVVMHPIVANMTRVDA